MEVFESKREIGLKIKRIRGKLTQERFGRCVGIHKNQISRYERGLAVPRPDQLKKIEDFAASEVGLLKIEEPEETYSVLTPGDRKLLDDVREILTSKDDGVINALESNIEVFLRTVRRSTDRRRCTRVVINIPVEIKIVGKTTAPEGILIDANQLGLRIQTSHQLEIGEKVKFEFSFPKDSGLGTFRTKAQIMWKNVEPIGGSETYGYGMKLLEVLDDGHAKLESLLHEEDN
jgi:transcriptional regulator with XRE-family HTH domain